MLGTKQKGPLSVQQPLVRSNFDLFDQPITIYQNLFALQA
jgi:hypothetical protein